MRVLRLIGGLESAFGGSTAVAVNGAVAAARQGVATVFLFPAADPAAAAGWPETARLEAAGIAVEIVPLAQTMPGTARRYGISGALAARLRQLADEVDIVHTHGAWSHASLVAASVGARRRVPVILEPHESLTRFDIANTRRLPLRLTKRLLRRWYGRSLACILFSSRLEQRDSTTGCETARLAVLPHPVHDDTDFPLPTGTPPGDGVVVGYLGRLHPKKNVALLIEALARLPGNVRLDIAGTGDPAFTATLHDDAERRGVGDRIRWLGFVAGAAKARFLSSIDLLAMPSDYECFGIVAAEAMIAGIPVILSPQTGVSEYIRDGESGLVVATDTAALAAAIGRLAEAPDLRAILAANAARAATAFAFRYHGEQLATLYAELHAGMKAS